MGATKRGRRWLVPVTAVAVVAGVGAFGPVVADASPDLPRITAQELLAKVQTAKVDGLSGTVRSRTDLGLPALPGVEGGQQLTDLLAGEHTARIAFASPDKARVAVLDRMNERVWTTDGKTGWFYDSASREATKFTFPARPDKPRVAPPREAYDPQAVAKRFLEAIDPSTAVEVTGTESVAGRDAYKLRLVPRTDKTTVGSVTLAVDSKTWVPLEVTVLPRTGKDPAVQVGFSTVSFDVPAASTFAFAPPKGTKITEETAKPHRELPRQVKPAQPVKPGDPGKPGVPGKPGTPELKPGTPAKPGTAAGKPAVIGSGWESVAVLRNVDLPTGNGPLVQLLANARTVEGSWGRGKILTSKMVSALVTTDGRVLIGLVTPSTLEAAAPKAPR